MTTQHGQTPLGPTLYDYAGVAPDASRGDLIDRVAELEQLAPGASRIRAAFALEALLDSEFRRTYDDHVRRGVPWRENTTLPVLPDMPSAPWGSPEMDNWVEVATNIVDPKRRPARKLARVAQEARLLLGGTRIPRFVLPVLVGVGALPYLRAGRLPLQGWLEGNVTGSNVLLFLAASAAGFLGALLTALYDDSRRWGTRATILAIAPLAGTAVVLPRVGIPALIALVLAITAVSRLAERQLDSRNNSTPMPFAPPSPWRAVDGKSHTRLGAPTTDPRSAAAVLLGWAQRLGHPVMDTTDDQLVAATIAADAWALALGADSLDQAASFGPASLGAISAAIARACGFAEQAMPILPGPDTTERRMPGLTEATRDWSSWADLQLGRNSSPEALARAAADLVWGGGNEDRLSRLARTLIAR